MDGPLVLRIVEAIQVEKNIDPEIVFDGMEAAILAAAKKHYGEEAEIDVAVDRKSGEPTVVAEGNPLNPNEIGELIGRIGAQTAKQVIIQKIREAERDTLYDEYNGLETQVVTGTVARMERGSAIVTVGKAEAILPRSEMIPGETHRTNERIRAVVLEVAKQGSKLKILLSRRHPDFVRRLFELEIPEVAEQVIEVRSLAREAGYRSKVAVSCFDNKIDAIGACVGVRGSRIRNIIEELGGERIDIIRWNDSLQVLVPNALEPSKVDDVILCGMLGKVIVLVQEEELSLAIGKKGQNVRLASKLVGWDIDVLTQERLDEQIDQTVEQFMSIPHVTEDLIENLIEQGFFTFDDLSIIEPDYLRDMSGLSDAECDEIIEYADRRSEELEQAEEAARQAQRDARRMGIELDDPSRPKRSTAPQTPPPGSEPEPEPTPVAETEPTAEVEPTADTEPNAAEPNDVESEAATDESAPAPVTQSDDSSPDDVDTSHAPPVAQDSAEPTASVSAGETAEDEETEKTPATSDEPS